MIWHIFKELGDPSWDAWALEREDGREAPPAIRLQEIRSAHGVRLHKGVHPDPSKRGPMVSISPFVHPDGFYYPRDFRCWWYDDGEKAPA